MNNKHLDVVLVNPGNRTQVYQSLGSELAAIEPPIWTGMTAKFMRDRGFSVKIIDSNAESLTPEETAARTVEIDPVLTAVIVYGHQPSASTQNMPAAGAICKALKKANPEMKIIMVGGHVSSLPERTMREEETDFVCEGEGPYTIEALVNCLKSNEPNNYKNIPGLWYRQENAIQSNPTAPLISDMDKDLNGLAWDLLPMEKYRAHNWQCFGQPSRKPYASIYTSLGCPFDCTFCCINAPFGGPCYRCRSPKSVIEEIDLLVNKYGVNTFKFADEIFVLKESHVVGICDLIIERGYDLNIWAYARVDTINKPGLLDKLRKAGFRWLCPGIEAGSARVRDDANKKTNQEDIYKAVNKIHSAGIEIIGNYLFGLPEDNMESMRETLDLAKDLNCAFANFYCAMAYPGSKLYNIAMEKEWPLPERWTGYSQHAYDTLPLPTNYLSGPEVLAFRDKAFKEYFSNPAYLENLNAKFGSNAVEEINKTLEKNLDRKYIS
ncbi:B12-binding domain-containing radical SAM protein [Verrucomicrobiota bacterium]